MSTKRISNAWKKGNRSFHSVYGVKDLYGRELLYMNDISIPKSDYKVLGIKSIQDVINISERKTSRYLESKGWKWIKLSKPYTE